MLTEIGLKGFKSFVAPPDGGEQRVGVAPRTWLLALHADKVEAGWRDVRGECDPRERLTEPLLRREGWQGPGRGRKAAMRALATQWRPLLSRSPELADLSRRVAAWLDAHR
jgi:hypothetical protein